MTNKMDIIIGYQWYDNVLSTQLFKKTTTLMVVLVMLNSHKERGDNMHRRLLICLPGGKSE